MVESRVKVIYRSLTTELTIILLDRSKIIFATTQYINGIYMDRAGPRLETLQAHLANLMDEYQATIQQFDCTLSGVDRVHLEIQLASIDSEMTKIEREIRLLK
jgi:hypothetical protein